MAWSLRRLAIALAIAALVVPLALTTAAVAQDDGSFGGMIPAPDRRSDEGMGPYDRLIIRGVTVIDGTGGPPFGPADVVVENNRIAQIRAVGYPGLPINEERRPGGADYEIDAEGMYLLPGLIDLHLHTGGPGKAPEAEYSYKLWMGNGITTGRGVGFGTMEFGLHEKARSEANEIVAPRMVTCARPGQGVDYDGPDPMSHPDAAREWVRYAASKGNDCLKLSAFPPDIMEALIDEAHQHEMGTTAHLAQSGVAQMNALDAARVGLDSMTHYYGLFEALYTNNSVQPYPIGHNYQNEQHRFGQVARQWDLVEPGGDKWNAVMQEMLDLDFFINPTMTIYSAGRDVMRARNADWHREYTLPSQWDFYQPSRAAHGSYWFYWTTYDEVAWRNFYNVWMQFLNEYKNRGGKVTLGSDSGFIYQLYGFGTILELEMLQEAGFHPLEVIRAATMHSAEELYRPRSDRMDIGIIREGFLADMILVDEDPLENLKVLYGTGATKLMEDGSVQQVGGIKYTIKDGIVYDAEQLRADVRAMVAEQKRERGME
jgi:imidazolonepropionase-like amidohydrolase